MPHRASSERAAIREALTKRPARHRKRPDAGTRVDGTRHKREHRHQDRRIAGHRQPSIADARQYYFRSRSSGSRIIDRRRLPGCFQPVALMDDSLPGYSGRLPPRTFTAFPILPAQPAPGTSESTRTESKRFLSIVNNKLNRGDYGRENGQVNISGFHNGTRHRSRLRTHAERPQTRTA